MADYLLPVGFECQVRGVHDGVDVRAKELVRSSPEKAMKGLPATMKDLPAIVAKMASLHGDTTKLAGPPQVVVYEILSNTVQEFWGGRRDSLGQESQQLLINALTEATASQKVTQETFLKVPALETYLLGDAKARDLPQRAKNLSELLVVLGASNDRVLRPAWYRTQRTSDVTGLDDLAFFVKPDSHTSPESKIFLVVTRNGWTE